ncbi:RHS repeat-associated core domain-containing protein [Chryseobacterium sp. Tr-659]|uniref:DUF6443 domain-containing protein n=1 Tax=Chryseobacterium sp. Tr-659 TaxID=2608340 RepID=UPI00141E25D2|nr:DUF6443 domain-containing protein [Chryseobacterium sp. Tr-659]NIF04019.1 RHS repeat-associated core domain-containing protein [Chryseobacterium sp. Tr-659]
MKKIIIPISVLLLAGSVKAQLSNTENYIYTKTYLDYDGANQATKISETVQYFDGLGRPKQIINIKASPLGRDVVTPIEYDAFGRQVKDYLPVPQSSTQNGAIVSNPLANAVQPGIYGSEKIYAQKILENSPLDRIQQQIQIGNDWMNKPMQFGYEANSDADAVRRFTISTIWENDATKSNITASDVYPASQLYKNTVTDEDGNKSVEFKNGQGQLILVRKILGTENADTYYVYNDYNQLALVIPPLLSKIQNWNANDLEHLAYQYRYDGRNRLVEKKIPGKGWELMVYDKQDRVVLLQDGALGTTNNNFNKKGWLFTKYDKFGRIVYTGFFTNSATRKVMQTALNNMAANPGNNESRSSTPFNLNGMDVYYTKDAFPTGSMIILNVNYYDTYPQLPSGVAIPSYIINPNQVVLQDAVSSVSTKSLPVASYTKNIEDDNWTRNYTWFDNKGRTIGTHSINHLGGSNRSEILLDFSGLIKESHTYHKRTANDTEVHIKETFLYDHQNRLLSQTHQVNNKPEEPIVLNSYNEIGQVINKKIGKDDDNNPLQSINYTYNIRGWLTSINDPANLGPDDIFALKIKYQNPEDINYGVARYNGNISEIDWKTALGDGIYRRYAYQYDGMNRLTQGIYLTPGLTSNNQNHYYDETMTYDINGNIKTLNRFKNPPFGQITPMQIDELVYEYDLGGHSNRLIKVTDQKMNLSGYPLGGNLISYDDNGNMSNHMDKNVKAIKYNYLNLPVTINAVVSGFTPAMNEGTLHTYKYRADGSKYAKRVDNINPYSTDYSETDYLYGFQYERTYSKMNTAQNSYDSGYILKFVPTAEGFYNFEKEEYVYNLKDHLGNVRYNIARADGGGRVLMEESNYYPFGLKHEGYNNDSYLAHYGMKNTYKYNGKELQETGMYDYGARNYMPDLGRWGAIDPLSDSYAGWSMYNMVLNNPVSNIDPDGMRVFTDYKLLQNGQVKRVDDKDGSENNSSDTLYATDKKGNVDKSKGSVTVNKASPESSSIIGDLAAGAIPDNTRYGYLSGSDGKKMFPLGVNRARTTNAADAGNVFLFAANNSNVEWGLAGYETGKNMTYAIWTGHNVERTPTSILYQGISKLSFEIHSHPGTTLIPSPIDGSSKGDYSSAGSVNNVFYENGATSYPRHFMYSKQGKHLWEYNYTSAGDTKYYPGRRGVDKPMPVGTSINLNALKK